MILALLLFGSGFSALVYQTLWLRLLGLVFGVTVYAASTVLAAFMAGLALGSFVSGRLADRVRSPLRWFAAAEALIGLTALSTPILLAALEAVYRQVHSTVSADLTVLTPVRFVASFAVLLVPTSLMGATMPFAVRAVVQRAPELGGRAAVLYAANTGGALMGALLTGYYLISGLGIASSFRLAAVCNLAVALGAWLWQPRPAAARRPAAPQTADADDRAVPDRVRRLVLFVFGVSGFVSLALEIVWFRALVLFIEATTYAFTVILALVLAGIAGGSALARLWLRRERDWIRWLAFLELGIGVAAIGSLFALAATYSVLWRRGGAVEIAALAVLPATILMGLAFPIGLHCWGRGGADADRKTGDRVGRFYMVNLAGSIAGALAAGFLLIPSIGTKGSLFAVSALSLGAGLLLLSTRVPKRTLVGGALACAALFAAAAVVVPSPINAVLATRYPGERVLWQKEGAQGTVTIHEQQGRHILYLDGLHQASNRPEMISLHRTIGSLGFALHPDPRDGLVIGLGGGVTAGAAARFVNTQIDLVELSPVVIEAARWFVHANGDVLHQPNVHPQVDDGRNYLLLTPKRYDVITADIIQPNHAGAGSLYSREYFELASRVLRDDGIMVQWIGNRPDTQYKLIARTFLDVFPDTTVWNAGTLLIGRKQPLTLSRAQYRQRLTDPVFSHALVYTGIFDFEGLIGRYTAGPEELRRFVGGGPLLTDDRPRLEFFRSLPAGEPDVALAGLKGDVERHLVP